MKKLFLSMLCCVFCLCISDVIAQCTFQIPDSVIVYHQDTLVLKSDKTFWICDGDSLNCSGLRNAHFVESGAKLAVSGFNNNVYLKSGATLNGFGVNDTVYYEVGATIIYAQNHVEILCDSIIFDYTHAPSSSCNTVNTNELFTADLIKLYPNPTSQSATLELNHSMNKKTDVCIYTIDGQLIHKMENITENRLEIENLTNGMYFIQVMQGNKLIQTEKLSVID